MKTINKTKEWKKDFKHCPTKGIDIIVKDDNGEKIEYNVKYDHHGRYYNEVGDQFIEEQVTHWRLHTIKKMKLPFIEWLKRMKNSY